MEKLRPLQLRGEAKDNKPYFKVLLDLENVMADRTLWKAVGQIDKYWEKLFADPIAVATPSGPVLIQPRRTNNILEQFFRFLKRSHRRRTGNSSSRRMLRTILAAWPLVFPDTRHLGTPV